MQHAYDSAPVGFNKVQLKYGPYSTSRLIVARCPARFLYKYIYKDKVVADAVASSRGNAIHEVLQKITEHHVRKEPILPKALEAWIDEAIGNNPAAYAQAKLVRDAAVAYAGNPSPYIAKSTLCEQAMAVSLFEEDSFMDDIVLKKAYVKVPYALGDDGIKINPEAFFGAKIDQLTVDEEIRVVTVLDHKSTPSANANADHDFQVGCYAWLASLFYPGYRIRTVLHYAHPSLNFYAPPVEWFDEDLMEIEQEIRTRVMAIESFREYPALPGSHCDYCHMVQQCPELKTIQEQNARADINLNISTIDDMVRVARQLRVTGVLYDQLNKKLKEAIENNCPESGIAIEGMLIGFKVSDEKVDWVATDRKIRDQSQKSNSKGNSKDLSDVLSKHGLDPNAFKEWRGDKLKVLFKAGKMDLIEELKPFLVTDRSTRFGSYKL